MKVIRIILVGLLYLAISTSVEAQKSEQHEEHKKAHQETMKQLDLTKEQQKSLKAINKDYRKKFKALEADETIEDAERRIQRRTLKKARQNEVQSVLTPIQVSKLKEIKEERQLKIIAKKGKQHKEELDLSDSQADEIKAAYEIYHPKLRAIKEDESLTEKERKSQIKDLREKKQNKVKSILTEEQFKKWKELKKEEKKK